MSGKLNNWTWKTRWVMRRNQVLGSARFQQWASRTPLIRMIARRKAAAQFDLVAGFVYSQILSAFVEAGLIGFLRGQVQTLPQLAAQAGLEPDATERLLKAGRALKLCESPQPGLWTLGEEGAALSANEGAIAMIGHHRLLYKDLADPLVLLSANRQRETALSTFWAYDAASADPAYSALMAATQSMVSQQIVDAYDFGGHRSMLDIGGGSGAFASAVAAAAPNLRLGIFDLPDVIAQAGARIGEGEIVLHAGSFKTDQIPSGYDLVTLSRIAHDHDDGVVAALFAAIYAALPPGGKLLIIEPMADSAHASRMGDAYFGLYLWAMNSGRPRTAAELTEMLQKAGFQRIRPINTALPIITSALIASK
jgi:demethylspheroidene O-methyltransferase